MRDDMNLRLAAALAALEVGNAPKSDFNFGMHQWEPLGRAIRFGVDGRRNKSDRKRNRAQRWR